MAVEEEAVEEETEDGAEEDTEGVSSEVEPVAIAVAACTVCLKQFKESAHQNGGQKGPKE